MADDDFISDVAVRACEIAWGDIVDERVRQVEQEGFDEQHDNAYVNGELAMAAACYAMSAGLQVFDIAPDPAAFWPFAPSEFHPKNPRADLVRAAALIMAEIERRDRATLTPPEHQA